MNKYDVIIVGAGLTGLVAACELGKRGKKTIILDQESQQNLGGQAFWSLGGLFMVDTPEQRRMGIKDSPELAYNDWMGSAKFDRDEDHWPRQWAKAYLEFAAGDMHAMLRQLTMRWFPIVSWAERGGSFANGHGNSVPRFHLTWGTGPGVLAPFLQQVREFEKDGLISFNFRHRVTNLTTTAKTITGVSGDILAADEGQRGVASNSTVTGNFAIHANSVIVTSGGIGANHTLVRKNWPTDRLGAAPKI